MLAFEVSNQVLDSIQRAVGAVGVANIIKRVVIKAEGVWAEMDGERAPVEGVLVADKFSIQMFQGALQAWLRGFGMEYDNFANGKSTLEEKVERKSNDLGLTAQRC
jgi:hypothetical protein